MSSGNALLRVASLTSFSGLLVWYLVVDWEANRDAGHVASIVYGVAFFVWVFAHGLRAPVPNSDARSLRVERSEERVRFFCSDYDGAVAMARSVAIFAGGFVFVRLGADVLVGADLARLRRSAVIAGIVLFAGFALLLLAVDARRRGSWDVFVDRRLRTLRFPSDDSFGFSVHVPLASIRRLALRPWVGANLPALVLGTDDGRILTYTSEFTSGYQADRLVDEIRRAIDDDAAAHVRDPAT